jgi:Na+-driven multidrug efflux pump
MSFFYVLPANTNGIQGFFRGMGQMNITLKATFTQIVFRVIFAYILTPLLGFSGIAFACLAGWVAMLTYEIPKLLQWKSQI